MSLTRVITDMLTDASVTGVKIATGAVSGAKIALTSEARGDIIRKDATLWSRLAIGTAGQVLGSDGTDPGWVNGTSTYTSAEQTITFDSVLQVAHGLAVRPHMIQVWLICKTTELGWAVDDQVLAEGLGGSSDFGFVVQADTTNVEIITGLGVRVIDQSTLNAATITAANWKYIVKAVY